jgi:hypothetical protein
MKLPSFYRRTSRADDFDPFPDLTKAKTVLKPRRRSYLFLLISIAIFLASLAYYLSQNPNLLTSFFYPNSPSPQTQDVPTPAPIVLVPDEGTKGNYVISQDKTIPSPLITLVTFDPLDAQTGDTLTITAKIISPTAITAVTGLLTQDNSQTPLTFSRIILDSGDDQTSLWSTTTTLQDTLLFRYILNLSAANASGTSLITVAPRS